jgi:hypothetical protein
MVGTPLLTCRPAGGAGTPFACSDLNACSLAALGTRDHHLLTGLAGDDHAQYAILAGRAGGQTAIGDTASGGHLTLQSTAHATRGYVRAQDDVQLLSGYLRDSAANARIQLATATPHVTITGDLRVTQHASLGSATPSTQNILSIADTLTADQYSYAILASVIGARASGSNIIYGVTGSATASGTPSVATVAGLYFQATHATPSPCAVLVGSQVALRSTAPGSGVLTLATGVLVPAASWVGAKPYTAYGIDVQNVGHASIPTVTGIRVSNQLGGIPLLLSLEGLYSFPYFQVEAGAFPTGNDSKCIVAFGDTPYRFVRNPGTGAVETVAI